MADAANVNYITVEDFTGGVTDFPDNARLNQYARCDNFVINQDKTIKSRGGTSLYATTTFIPPSGQARPGGNFEYFDGNNYLKFVYVSQNIHYIKNGAWTTLLGQSGNSLFPGGTQNSRLSTAFFNRQQYCAIDAFSLTAPTQHDSPARNVFQNIITLWDGLSIYDFVSNTINARQIGFPVTTQVSPGNQHRILPGFAGWVAGAHTYIWQVFFSYTYTVGIGADTTTFLVNGPPRLITQSGLATADGVNNAVFYWDETSGFGVPANLPSENYDWNGTTVELYRTVADGTTFFFVGSILSQSMKIGFPLTDAVSDTALVSRKPIYTDGGVVSNDRPPQAKYLVTVNNCLWAGHCVDVSLLGDTSNYVPNRLRQSLPLAPDSWPGDFFIDFEESIVGLGAVGIYPIVFTNTKIYRVEGQRDLLGRGSLQKREISRTIGGINQQSVVNTIYGCFFGGTDGFYWTDGFSAKKISRNLEKTYAQLTLDNTRKKNLYGTMDGLRERVIWLGQSTGGPDNDTFYVLDLRWGINEQSAFTTWSSANNFHPAAIMRGSDGVLTFFDAKGYFFKFDKNSLTDPKIDLLVNDPTQWQQKAIIWDYIGPSGDGSTAQFRKYSSQIVVYCDNLTNFATSIKSANDDTNNFQVLPEIRYDQAMTWGDLNIAYGSTKYLYPWNSLPIIDGKRRFPAHHLRFSRKQIEITNSLTNIYKSDDYATVTAAAANPFVNITLLSGTFPLDVVDYFISFDSDAYTANFLIKARTSGTALSVYDPKHAIVIAGGKKWVIRGYRKGDAFLLRKYSIPYMALGRTQDQYRGPVNTNA